MGDIKKEIGIKIRTFREQRGLTQEKLGAIADMHRAYIGHIERGEKNITIDNLQRIAKALRVGIKDLIP
ncbi:MAG: helix-turn-helix domain-containing protein [Sedimentisphaerales bacterium]|nr:helix-turn-helix domain-containing protein [Sedimentisphaerales bacterium]